MAERRMFAKTIVLSDAFLDMPMSARNLYFTLGMVADDDGFVNNPRSIMRQISATDDDMKILIAKKFVLIFDNGVIVIKHWRINNYLRSDRYKDTKYLEERGHLTLDENGAYHMDTGKPESGIPAVYQPVDNRETQDRLGKVSTGEVSIGQDNTIPSTTQIDRIEGEYEGAAPDSSDLSTEKGFPSFSQGRNEDNRAYWRRLVSSYKRLGFDPAGLYELAAADGLTRDDIDKEVST